MKNFLKTFFYIIGGIYPIAVFVLLVVLKIDIRIFSLFMIVFGCAVFLSSGTFRFLGKEKRSPDFKPILSSVLFFSVGLLCFLTNKSVFLRLYSVAVSISMLFVFSLSLVFKPNICFRFAVLADKSIINSLREKKIYKYCKKVTLVWCVFFIINAAIAAYTALYDFGSDELNYRIWSVYNGGISYFLMALIFAIEFIVRKKTDKKMPKSFSITKFKANSREDSHIICYEANWASKKYKTWYDFLVDTAKMRTYINSCKYERWILHCDDYWYFLVAFVALLQCRKCVILTQNISQSFIDEIKDSSTVFLSGEEAKDSVLISKIIEKESKLEKSFIRSVPKIDSDQTQIIMYTSGSTGTPKAVFQRMTEFELDNEFVISKWGEEFYSRKLVTTVSQHHIYGFLFGICLPFTLGVPFRRSRITFPEEFETLSDISYTIVATPAFLKRTVESLLSLDMKDTWIFTSGGAVSEELAVKINKLFGIYPLEVYGSTETSGIAWRRQDLSGLLWTAFDNAKIWLSEEGTLRIVSPYIKDPQGFLTADLAEIMEDGRFLLKGRKDSIVKIEEKRISLVEVENRILQTGFVEDVKVIALENGVRQYLAAAVVFNKEGEEFFCGKEKYLINRYMNEYLLQYFENVVIPKKWRYIKTMPTDAQGKKHKTEIQAFFE